MKKGDFIWAGVLLLIIVFLAIDSGRQMYIEFTGRHPYFSGFLKYMVLASMGELLSIRLKRKYWSKSTGFYIKAVIWGCIGILITFVFKFYSEGAKALQLAGLLAGNGKIVSTAIFTSVIMNLTFGIALFISHRITDEIIDYRFDNSRFNKVSIMIEKVDWPVYLLFIFKMIVFFWIPVHAAVFLLPEVYRVMTAAFLSIALGILLSLGSCNQRIGDILHD
ncbi:MAG: hypothetical protein JEZ04_07885 [Spirochaetales bacterium]|nr:hypothetical protein [Spirochaetales bacterium]